MRVLDVEEWRRSFNYFPYRGTDRPDVDKMSVVWSSPAYYTVNDVWKVGVISIRSLTFAFQAPSSRVERGLRKAAGCLAA